MNHRVEVLRPGSTHEFEFWSNASGSVYLCREQGAKAWQAIIDGDVVVDRDPAAGLGFTHPVEPLTAPGVLGLVPLLAMQERLHVILEQVEAAPAITAD